MSVFSLWRFESEFGLINLVSYSFIYSFTAQSSKKTTLWGGRLRSPNKKEVEKLHSMLLGRQRAGNVGHHPGHHVSTRIGSDGF